MPPNIGTQGEAGQQPQYRALRQAVVGGLQLPPPVLPPPGPCGSPCLKNTGGQILPALGQSQPTSQRSYGNHVLVYCGIFYMQEPEVERHYLEGEPGWVDALVTPEP